MGPLQSQEGVKTSNRFPCSLPKAGRAGSLYGVRVGVYSGVGLEGRLRCSAHPSSGVHAAGMHSTLLLFLIPCFCSRLFKGGSSVFESFCIFLRRICPNCACTELFLVPYSFFVFCCWRRGLSRCKHCSTAAKGPRSQPVSDLLSLTVTKQEELKSLDS